MFLSVSSNNQPSIAARNKNGGEGGGLRWIVHHPRCLQRELIRDHPTRLLRATHLKSAKTHLTSHWVTESTLPPPFSDIWTFAASIIGVGGNREVGLVQIQQTWRRFCKNPKKIFCKSTAASFDAGSFSERKTMSIVLCNACRLHSR